ncbi:organic cation transporter-like protein [Ditylenchus destructor]|nr:organic cation transporter-like protein [Ditylenchus destructor]
MAHFNNCHFQPRFHEKCLSPIIISVILVLLFSKELHGVSILVVNLLGVVCNEYTWDACYLCIAESRPTEMRASALGSCSLVARILAVLAPALAFMNTIWAPSAYLTICCLGCISLFVSWNWLIETKGIKLDNVKLHEAGDLLPNLNKIDAENKKFLDNRKGAES